MPPSSVEMDEMEKQHFVLSNVLIRVVRVCMTPGFGGGLREEGTNGVLKAQIALTFKEKYSTAFGRI